MSLDPPFWTWWSITNLSPTKISLWASTLHIQTQHVLSYLTLPYPDVPTNFLISYVALCFGHTPKPRCRDLSLTSSYPSFSSANKCHVLLILSPITWICLLFSFSIATSRLQGSVMTSLVYYKSCLLGLILMLPHLQSSFQITARVFF